MRQVVLMHAFMPNNKSTKHGLITDQISFLILAITLLTLALFSVFKELFD